MRSEARADAAAAARRWGGAALLAVFTAGCRTVAPFDAPRRAALAESVVADWPASSRLTAAFLIEEYGPPDALAARALGWSHRGRWKRIVLAAANAERGTAEIIEETVAYRAPPEKRAAMAALGAGLSVSPDGRELSARSDDEASNYLALNLADEVARGVRDADGARRFYRATLELEPSGKSSRYTRELMFPPPSQDEP